MFFLQIAKLGFVGKMRAKGVFIIAVFLIVAGCSEYFIMLHVHTKQYIPYLWVHDDQSQVQFEHLAPHIHKLKRFNSVQDKIYVNEGHFDDLKDAFGLKRDLALDKNEREHFLNGRVSNISPLSPSRNEDLILHPPDSPPFQSKRKKSLSQEHDLNQRADHKEHEHLDEEKDLQEQEDHKPPVLENPNYDIKDNDKVLLQTSPSLSTSDEDDYEEEDEDKLDDYKKDSVVKKPREIDPDNYMVVNYGDGPKIVKKSAITFQPEVLIENDLSRPYRSLSLLEKRGSNIMFTLRTTRKYHEKRLPLLYNTWMTKVNPSNIFLVTDGEDKKWLKLASTIGRALVHKV